MSGIESLLGPAPESPPGEPPLVPRTLLLEDVLIHLLEDETREEVVLYSVPGRMPLVDWLEGQTQPWTHSVPLPADGRASTILSIDPATRDVFLADVWPRAALDAVTFGMHVDGHALRHRLWRDALSAPNADHQHHIPEPT